MVCYNICMLMRTFFQISTRTVLYTLNSKMVFQFFQIPLKCFCSKKHAAICTNGLLYQIIDGSVLFFVDIAIGLNFTACLFGRMFMRTRRAINISTSPAFSVLVKIMVFQNSFPQLLRLRTQMFSTVGTFYGSVYNLFCGMLIFIYEGIGSTGINPAL